MWGDDEDIVIIPGFLHYKKEQILTILPGTIVLFAARYREDRKGAMQEETEEFIADAWARILDDYTYQLSDPEIEPIISSPAFTDYLSWALVDGNLMARGNRNNPILICSDASAPTPWDFQVFDAATGVLDYAVIRNCTNFELKMAENLAARSTFVTLATSLSGNGYRLANHFGLSGNESIFTFRTNQPWFEGDFAFRHVCRYNLFDNRLMCGIGLNYLRNGNQHHVVEHNRILTGYPPVQYDVPEEDLYTENVTIRYNDFLGAVGDTYLRTMTNSTLDATHNYWGTDHPSEVEKHIDHRPRIAGQGEVLYEPIRTSPDSDLDGLTDGEEQEHGTDPAAMDTDGDRCIDGLEVNEYKTDPLRFDTDGDGIPDGLEVYINTDPLDDADFTRIGQSGDLFYDHIQIVDAGSIEENDTPSTNPSAEPTATAENPNWPSLGLPPDFQGTRMGIDYSKYMTNEPFDLDKEVERVLTEIRVGKGVPPVLDKSNPYHALWHREAYQPIIDAAREAFHKHRDTKTGTPGVKTETINVTGNVMGKDTLAIRYFSGDVETDRWGFEEDIVYVTGTWTIPDLLIAPGTLVLFASLQDDQRGGAMPPDLVDTLHTRWQATKGHGADHPSFMGVLNSAEYNSRMILLHVTEQIAVRGEERAPILFVSDAVMPSAFDFTGLAFETGVVDHAVYENNCGSSSANSDCSLLSRSKLDNIYSTCHTGPGYIIANFFGSCRAECICIDPDIPPGRYEIAYNVFKNRSGGGITIEGSDNEVVIQTNTFFETGWGLVPPAQNRYSIGGNDFLCTPSWGRVTNHTGLTLNLSGNYWGAEDAEIIGLLIEDKHDMPTSGELAYMPIRRSPVPMPFLTGIPEIDAVYKGPPSD